MTPWTKLVAGNPARKTRLHDEGGARIPAGRLARNLPVCLASIGAQKLAGDSPQVPWISYDGRERIARFLASGEKHVLEFGSGNSTYWYARRAAALVSVEHDRAWYRKVAPGLAKLPRVEYRLAEERSGYCGFEPGSKFDLIMIDGAWRDDCARFAADHVAEGGAIYLDNSDKNAGEHTGDVPAARRFLIDFADRSGLPWEEITDFAPGCLFAQRALLVGAIAEA